MGKKLGKGVLAAGIILAITFTCLRLACPQQPQSTPDQSNNTDSKAPARDIAATGKAFEAAVAFAQSLSQWSYITIAASLALVFKDLHAGAKSRWLKYSYLLFFPGWSCLFLVIYMGFRVHGAYIAYLMMPAPNVDNTILAINADASCQLNAMFCGLGIFSVWLISYLLWLILHREADQNEALNLP